MVASNVLGFLGGLVDLNLEFLKRLWYITICKIDKWKTISILHAWFLPVLRNILDFESLKKVGGCKDKILWKLKVREITFSLVSSFPLPNKQMDGYLTPLSSDSLVSGVWCLMTYLLLICQRNVVLKCEINVLGCKSEALNRRDTIYQIK